MQPSIIGIFSLAPSMNFILGSKVYHLYIYVVGCITTYPVVQASCGLLSGCVGSYMQCIGACKDVHLYN